MVLSRVRIINLLIWLFVIVYLLICSGLLFLREIDFKTFILLFSVPWSIATTLYIKNDKAFLFISKYILRPFFISSNDWSFSGVIRGVEDFKTLTLKDLNQKKGIFPDLIDKISIKKLSINKYRLLYDQGKVILDVEYFPNKKEVKIFTNKFTVSDTAYDNMLNTLYEIIKIIKLSLEGNSIDEKYTIVIYYEDNPYYGFYLKQIPKTFIKDFSLKLAIPSKVSNILVNKNKIQISATDFEYLKDSTKRVLELSELPS